MATLKNTWFIAFSLVWVIIFTLTKLHIYLPNIFQFYTLDLIAVPVLANLGLWFLRFLLQDDHLKMKPWQLLFIVLIVSIFFEVLMPIYNSKRYSADILDVFCYIFGGLFFWLVMNKAIAKSH
jgi:hypothetical protein